MFLELGDRILRSWWTIVAGVCFGVAGSTMILSHAPKLYEASTKIFVAQPKIPEEYVRSVVTDDSALRLEALKEAVLSRPYMLRLIESTFGLPESEEDAERLMGVIRGRVQVTVLHGLFVLSYRDNDPTRAANVVNTLADLYTQQNAQFRAERAKETTQTLADLAQGAKAELQVKEKQIAEFRARHLYDTGDQLQANLQIHASLQKDLESNAKALSSAQERLQILEAQKGASGAPLPVPSGPSVGDPYTARLSVLQQELEALRVRYQETHPDVVSKRREVEELMARMGTAVTGSTPTTESGRPMTPLEIQIRAADREVRGLETERVRIRADLATYQGRIEATPRVEQQLAELTKGYDVLLDQYRTYQSKAGEAKGSQIIEESQKGAQFEVIERAVPPSIPVSPVPLVVYALGLVGGLVLFVGPVLVLALLHPVVHSEQGLESLSDVPVLASIPRIDTPGVRTAARRALSLNIGLSALSAAVLAAVVLVGL
jgi:polysaccharide chain length determinant protein (PEP-CTERM system associated)